VRYEVADSRSAHPRQQPAKAPESKGAAKPMVLRSLIKQMLPIPSRNHPNLPRLLLKREYSVIRRIMLAPYPKMTNEMKLNARHTRKTLKFNGKSYGLQTSGFCRIHSSRVMVLQWLMYRRQAGIMADQIITTRDTERAWVIASPLIMLRSRIYSGRRSNMERHLVGADKHNVFTVPSRLREQSRQTG